MNTTARDLELISDIATRAVEMFAAHGEAYDKVSATMDITSVHLDTPLDLDRLLAADDGLFAHDVTGIRRHMDRVEYPGKLGGCFLPKTCI